ncbi:hypothetical protein HDV00_000112 [Rhizophlyctis rosea]|nr:hypothetical protein HDV00_000112 [Rhizophlyctis rosea]
MSNLEHSKIPEGRIKREELQYHLHLSSILDQKITTITSMSANEVTQLRHTIITKFEKIFNAARSAYNQWVTYGFTTSHDQADGSHGGGATMFRYEGRSMIKKTSGMLPDLDHMERERLKLAEYKRVYSETRQPVREAFIALMNEVNEPLVGWEEGSTEEREKMVQDFGGRVANVYEMLLDFILESVRGRTFLNSLK